MSILGDHSAYASLMQTLFDLYYPEKWLRGTQYRPDSNLWQVITIKVRINCIDSYQAAQQPVIRVYGPDELGQSTVVHVHGFYPYFYVQCNREPSEALCHEIHNRVDAAMATAYKRQQPFIHRVSIIKATSIYGYQTGLTKFLKLELRNPVFVNKCADLIFNGLVENVVQPFECHIPYLLHFMADHNLYGCNWLTFSKYQCNTKIALLSEVDINFDDIESENPQLASSSQREIASLRELQVADQKLRKRLGKTEFDMRLKSGEFEQIEWENIERMRSALSDRLQQSVPRPVRPSSRRLEPSQRPSRAKPLSLNQELSLTVTPTTQPDDSVVVSGLGTNHVKDAKSIARKLGEPCAVLFTSSPSAKQVRDMYGICAPKTPFYSKPADVPFFPFNYGGKAHHIKSLEPANLPPFVYKGTSNPLQAFLNDADGTAPPSQPKVFQLGLLPPSRAEVVKWQKIESTPTHDSFKMPSMPEVQLTEELKLMCIEVFTTVRSGKTPFAELDKIEAIVWSTHEEQGALIGEELDIIEELVRLVRAQDPDLLGGFEVSKFSWGYVAERYSVLTDDFLDLGKLKPGNAIAYTESLVHPGRYSFDLWSILRHEVPLYRYTLESVVWHVLHERTPHLSFDDLYELWNKDSTQALEYLYNRLRLTFKLVAHLELISKYAEQSRLIGIDFNSSITRGSQYKVEAVLCRLSKRRNFLLLSPSRKQVANQQALEYIPLVMEPKSAFYTDPVCVLDFRSLYPSIVMAFNLCYSTCIGRLELWKGRNKLGVLEDLALPSGLKPEDLFIAPNGVAYVKPRVRKSIVATMLAEILESRFMVKASMDFGDIRHRRNMNSKQTALKLLANVTYGYISASFSGRMPCAEIADSIVSIGRELLVQSIAIIEAQLYGDVTPRVVYGDTDSLFVLLRGASRAHAFEIGKKLAQLITASLPQPMELEMEKVYDPCILLTKKRYVGNSYASPSAAPFFDAKGTETIRRDGVPILQHLEKTILQKLFSTYDLTLVKAYFCREMSNILAHRLLPSAFLFSQKVRLGNYKAAQSNLPGGAVVSLRAAADDPGALPQYNERVSFLVTQGTGLINDRVVSPSEFLRSQTLLVDADYYINQVIIPPLERVLGVLGADCRAWFAQVPRPKRGTGLAKQCLVCFSRSDEPVCEKCSVSEAVYLLNMRLSLHQRTQTAEEATCNSCSTIGSLCQSLDCEVYFSKERTKRSLREVREDLDYLDL